MTLEQMARWETTRQMGRRWFIWRWGVLAFGLPWGIVMALLFGFAGAASHPPALWIGPVISGLLSPLAGYLFGATMWSRCETQYIETKELHEIIRAAPRSAEK
jgi:hypothetical protein